MSMDQTLDSIGQRIRAVRLQHRLTIKEFAEALGVGMTSITNYEKDARTPDTAVLRKLYEDFGVNLHWLIAGSPRQGPDLAQNLSEEEADLIALCRQCPESVVKKMMSFLIALSAHMKKYDPVTKDWQ